MASLRVIFLVTILVTIVAVIASPTETRGTSKYKALKSTLSNSKLGNTVRDYGKKLAGSSHAQKVKGIGQSAHNQFKSVAEKHPGAKEKATQIWDKIRGAGTTASQKTRGVSTKSQQVIRTVQQNIGKVRTVVQSLQTASALKSQMSGVTNKLSGITSTFSKKRGVTKGDALKSAMKAGSQKVGVLKEVGKSRLNTLRDKGANTLSTMKKSAALKKVQDKVPVSSIQTLKKLAGSNTAGLGKQ